MADPLDGDTLAPMSSRTGTCLTEVVAESLRDACRESTDFDCLIVAGHKALSSAVVEGHDLSEMWRESDPDKRLAGGYRRHQVVRDAEHGFTVVVLLWEPGAVTPIHDHDTWCVFGVLQGVVEVTNYQVLEDDGRAPLVLREHDRELVPSGIIGDNRESLHEVHRVRNVGTERAISLHVYGSDLTQRKPFDGRGCRVDGKTDCIGFKDSQPVY